jgi:YggT family protein
MVVLAESPFLRLACLVMLAYLIILFVLFILSFVQLAGVRMPSTGPGRAALDLLDDVTRPVLDPLRKVVPPVRAGGVGIDLSLTIAFVVLLVLHGAICP